MSKPEPSQPFAATASVLSLDAALLMEARQLWGHVGNESVWLFLPIVGIHVRLLGKLLQSMTGSYEAKMVSWPAFWFGLTLFPLGGLPYGWVLFWTRTQEGGALAELGAILSIGILLFASLCVGWAAGLWLNVVVRYSRKFSSESVPSTGPRLARTVAMGWLVTSGVALRANDLVAAPNNVKLAPLTVDGALHVVWLLGLVLSAIVLLWSVVATTLRRGS